MSNHILQYSSDHNIAISVAKYIKKFEENIINIAPENTNYNCIYNLDYIIFGYRLTKTYPEPNLSNFYFTGDDFYDLDDVMNYMLKYYIDNKITDVNTYIPFQGIVIILFHMKYNFTDINEIFYHEYYCKYPYDFIMTIIYKFSQIRKNMLLHPRPLNDMYKYSNAIKILLQFDFESYLNRKISVLSLMDQTYYDLINEKNIANNVDILFRNEYIVKQILQFL